MTRTEASPRSRGTETMLGVAVGLLSIVSGILILAWPGATLLLVGLLFGLQLAFLGGARVVTSLKAPADPPWLKPLGVILGVLAAAAGVVCFIRPGASIVALAVIVAAGWMAEGFAWVARAVATERTMGLRIWFAIAGLVSIISAFVVLVFPAGSLLLLTRIGGIMLVVIGLVSIVIAAAGNRMVTATSTPGAGVAAN